MTADALDGPDRVTAELSAYPRVAACPTCRAYAADHLPTTRLAVALAATLAYHDSGHLEDCLTLASQHFG